MKRDFKFCEVFIGGGVNFPFLAYCWAFYNEIDGVFPIRGLTLQMMADACAYVQANEPECPWAGGDTDDRTSACAVVLKQNPQLKNPYEQRQ